MTADEVCRKVLSDDVEVATAVTIARYDAALKQRDELLREAVSALQEDMAQSHQMECISRALQSDPDACNCEYKIRQNLIDRARALGVEVK